MVGREGEEGGRRGEEGEGTGGDSIENGPIIQVNMDGSAATPTASLRCKGPTSARTEDRPQLAPRSMDEWMIRRRTGCTECEKYRTQPAGQTNTRQKFDSCRSDRPAPGVWPTSTSRRTNKQMCSCPAGVNCRGEADRAKRISGHALHGGRGRG